METWPWSTVRIRWKTATWGCSIYGDEGEGTLKRYLQRGNSVVLQPFNPNYNELIIKGEELNHLHIAGRVVETKAKW